MRIKSLVTSYNNRVVNLTFPMDKKVISLHGNGAKTVLHTLTSLLAMEYNNQLRVRGEVSEDCNVDYSSMSTVTFENGASISGVSNAIQVRGNVEDLTFLYYNGDYCMSLCSIAEDSSSDEESLSEAQCVRIATLFNKFVGEEMVIASHNDLYKEFYPINGMDESQLQFIFNFITLLVQTKSCIVLLHEIKLVPMEKFIKLLGYIDSVEYIVTSYNLSEGVVGNLSVGTISV